MSDLSQLQQLFSTVDGRDGLMDRVRIIVEWLEKIPGVEEANLLCTDRLRLGPEDHAIHRIDAEKADLLPSEPAILNGKSPIPSGVFDRPDVSPVTVYSPFADLDGTFAGALLIKSTLPKQFMRNHRPLLGVLASKTKDLVDIAVLRGSGNSAARQLDDDLTPRVIERLMDLLGLPMYVMSPDGQFASVNDAFLESLNYADLADVNNRSNLFIRQDDLGSELRKLAQSRTRTPTTIKVRTGDNRVRTVQDFSTLVGRNIVGVLMDVSEFVSVNEQLSESLESQRHLNERLSSTTALLQKTQATAMKSLAKLAEYRDKETGGHLQRMCEYMRLVTREIHRLQPYSFHVSNEYPEDIYLSGMLHDIGKVGVPDQILLKPGPLDDAEWVVMKKHTTWGHTLLNQADHELGEQSFLTLASRIALHHHEWWDGHGYPYGLAGEDIPLSARIGAVADVYDALTSRRPYKEAWSHDQAVTEISGLTGQQFDPIVTEIFNRHEKDFESIRNRFPDDLPVPG